MKRNRGIILIIVPIICLLVIILALLFVAALSGQFTGLNSGAGGAGDGEPSSAIGNAMECSGVANVPVRYMDWVKDAARIHLGGDEALLISLIQNESSWNPAAKNISKTTHAVGLGQFQPATARGWPEFVGGDDKHGKDWPNGYVYDGNPPSNDARFDAKRSIYASAHYLSNTSRLHGGDYLMGYEKNYHGGSYGPTARKNLETIYNKVKKGCIILPSSIPNVAGGSCGVTKVNTANVTYRSADMMLMPQAAADFNNMAEDFYKTTKKKLDIVSMFRSRADQISMCGRVVNGRCTNNRWAAPPGNSLHEAGLAVDIGLQASGNAKSSSGLNSSQYSQFKAIAVRHRFAVNSGSRGVFGAGESWHFDYVGLKDRFWYGQPKMANAIRAAINCLKSVGVK